MVTRCPVPTAGSWQAGSVRDDHAPKPLLVSRGILPLRHVSKRTGISVERLESVIYAGLLPEAALFDENGKALHVFEDSVPSRQHLLDLLSTLEKERRP